MYVEILDVKGGTTFRIEGEQTFGREGANADIGVPDRTVSSRHARIFEDGGTWYIEDLNSSNGTFVGGDRISQPMRLELGLRFALCRYSYEVVNMGGGDDDEAIAPTAVFDEAPIKSDIGYGGFRDDTGDVQPATPMGDGEMSITGPGGYNNGGYNTGGGGSYDRDRGRSSGDDEVPAGPDQPLVPYLLSAVPKAVAFYIAAIPVLLFNPVGTIKKSINEQPFDAMSPKEIMAYAIPPGLLGVIIGSIGGIIMALVHGTFAASLIISPLIGAAISIVIAIVTGFIFHPVLTWLIEFLKGHSDARSRTNFFILVQTAVPLGSIATGIAIFLALIPLPFVSIVTPILSLAATLILFFGLFAWYRYFEVHKIIPILILLGGAFACFGTVMSMIDIVRADIAGLSGGGSVADVGDPEAAAENAAALATITQQIESLRAAGQLTPDVEAALREQAAALSQGGAAAGAAAAQAAAAQAAAAGRAGAEAAEAATEAAEAATKGAAAATTNAAAAAAAGAEAASAAEEGAAAPSTPTSAGGSSYPEYARKRAAVEAAIDNDPTLLEKRPIMTLYKELLRETAKAKQKHKVSKKRKSPTEIAVETRVAERLAQAETFRATGETVNKLHKRIFGK